VTTDDATRLDRARLTVLSGPSGVGKDSVIEQIRARARWVWLSVSVTTRKIRPNEVDGVHYTFVDRPDFERMVLDGQMLEWAEFAGNLYGTPRQPVDDRLARGEPVLLKIDLQGARQVLAAMPEAQLVFLAPPSWEELQRRLVGRGTEDRATIQDRLEHAHEEMAAEPLLHRAPRCAVQIAGELGPFQQIAGGHHTFEFRPFHK